MGKGGWTPEPPDDGTEEPTTPTQPDDGTEDPTTPTQPDDGTEDPTTPTQPDDGTEEPTTPTQPDDGTDVPDKDDLKEENPKTADRITDIAGMFLLLVAVGFGLLLRLQQNGKRKD